MTAILASSASRSFGLNRVQTLQNDSLSSTSANTTGHSAPSEIRVPCKASLDCCDPDALVVQLALAGKESAYSAIVKRYQRMVYSLAIDITKNREDADEATQDAFIKAFRYLGNWRGECRFSTWLYHVARTAAIDRRNRRRLVTVSLDDDSNDSGARLKRVADTTPGADEGLLNGERRTQIHEALAELMPPDRNVLILYYLQDQTLEEICQIMGWTMSNAKSRLSRARQRLRLLMEDAKEQFSLN